MQGGVPGAVNVAPNSGVFDLSDQEQILALLNFVRQSTLDPDAQTYMRDMVLDYSATKDYELIGILNKSLDSLGVRVVDGPQAVQSQATSNDPAAVVQPPKPEILSGEPQESAQTTPQTNTGFRRARPVFAPPRTTRIEVAAKTAPAIPKVTLTPPADLPIQTDVQTLEPAQAEASVSAVPTPKPASSVTAPEPNPVLAPESSVPEPAPVIPVEPNSVSAPAPVEPPAAARQGEPLERIKEIKRVVNEQVGNPVNLIDAHNEVGREYMNALLDAMKKVHGQEASGTTAAMERLEAAFAAVQAMLVEKPVTSDVTPTPAVAAPTSGFAAAAAPEPELEKEEVTTSAPLTPPPVPEKPIAPTPAPAEELATVPAAMEEKVVETTVAPTPAPEVSSAPAGVTPPAAPAGVASVAAMQAEAAKVAPQPEPEPTPAATDPLQSEIVTNGLNQLLSEWKLFKSSGLFGTGPSGAEHPLYQLMAPLSMSEVITGRFEGVTPEIKQSITDYMNGWRYEHGMVHEMEETFEHYLRRVIKAVLDKQPKTT